MKLRILSWNVREANDYEKRKVIKALIKDQNVDLVCLQETKMQEMSERIVWTRIFHVRPHSIDETRFLFVKN